MRFLKCKAGIWVNRVAAGTAAFVPSAPEFVSRGWKTWWIALQVTRVLILMKLSAKGIE